MSENLNFKTNNSWSYNNNEFKRSKYGRLYTWEAAINACPDYWHLPGEKEWQVLEIYLGTTKEEVNIIQYRGGGKGIKLKNSSEWHENPGHIQEYNCTGFNELPGGYRYLDDSTFLNLGKRASFWSITPDGKYAI